MSSLTRADILPLDDFAAVRTKHQADVIAAKAVRRVTVGEHLSFLFESRATVRWQIHEMCRIEGLTGDAIDHELKTYNALLPTADSLSATLLIEYDDPQVRDIELRRLLGLHQHVWLELEGLDRIPARFDADQFNEVRISAVQFLRFPLDEAARAAFGDLGRSADIVIDHPEYQARTGLSRATRGALLDDLDEA